MARLGTGIALSGQWSLRTAARSSRGTGRILALIAASLALVAGLGAVAGGAVAVVFDQTQRDGTGYLTLLPDEYLTSTYALVSNSYRTGVGGDVLVPRALLGTIRLRARSEQPIFVGIGPAAAVDAYLANVQREVVPRLDGQGSRVRVDPGGAPAVPPTTRDFWAASSVGPGPRTLYWSPRGGSWRIVVMNANGSPEIGTELTIGARFPHLLWAGIASLAGGLFLIVLARLLLHARSRAAARTART